MSACPRRSKSASVPQSVATAFANAQHGKTRCPTVSFGAPRINTTCTSYCIVVAGMVYQYHFRETRPGPEQKNGKLRIAPPRFIDGRYNCCTHTPQRTTTSCPSPLGREISPPSMALFSSKIPVFRDANALKTTRLTLFCSLTAARGPPLCRSPPTSHVLLLGLLDWHCWRRRSSKRAVDGCFGLICT